jgi:hypothetical protein
MQRTVQIYVKDVDGNYQRLDLFKDENISITDKIQDVRDIAKVFTEFSQSFSVPASKTNNKIFKHFYNADIVDGFDARTLKQAKIEINNIPFKTGYITLEGVDLKDNSPNTYRITFYGNTVSLKDLIGDDKLSALTNIDWLSVDWSSSDIERGLKRDSNVNSTGTVDSISGSSITDSSGFGTVRVGDLIINTTTEETTYITSYPTSTVLVLNEQIFTAGQAYEVNNHVLTPLITHSKRLFYKDGEHGQGTGNLWYESGSGTSHHHGVAWRELKYALRIHKIIEAIESKYLTPNGFSFSNDFFTSSNETYYKLFMWLHRKKGVVSSGGQIEEYTKLVDGWSVDTGYYADMINTSTIEINNVNLSFVTNFDLELIKTSGGSYGVSVSRDGTEVYSEGGISDSYKLINLLPYLQANSQYTVTLTYSSTATFSEIEWKIYDTAAGDFYNTSDNGNFVIPEEFEFVISQQMPDMKILDFLTGLFKMFNLTAVAKSDGTIYVDTLDEFYVDEQSSGSPYTIDEYVDSTKTSSDSALPYREVKFTYEDTETLLAKQHEQISGTVWAEEQFDRIKYNEGKSEDEKIQDNISGEIYTVEVPFGHLKYEKILDLDSETTTGIQWGYSADDNFDETTGDYGAYIGKPVLFYPVYQQPTQTISFIDLVSDGVYDNHEPITGSVSMPSNSIYFDSSSPNNSKNINFKPEKNEYTNTEFEQTLFKEYYETYITQVFTKSNRIIKLKAFLPLKILLNYTLADKFIYKGRKHQINSITTNITTGESQIELLNIVIE